VLQLQAKLVPFRRGGGMASFGGLIGALHQTGGLKQGAASWAYYGKALASLYPASNLEIDLNLGAAYLSGPGTYAIGGVAVQYRPIDRLQVLGELFRDEPGRSKYQAGLRFFAIPDRLEAYVSVGNRIGGASTDWWTIIGIRLQTKTFLP